jgi:hypothetical protein
MLFESTQPCRNSLGLIGVLCRMQHSALSLILCPGHCQLVPTCPHLQQVTIFTDFASADAIRNLLQLQTDTPLTLALRLDQWLAVADEIRLGRCLIKDLALCMVQSSSSEASEAVQAVASTIRGDRHFESFMLQMEDGFTDEAGVALAEALTINKTLHELKLDDNRTTGNAVNTKASLGAQAYKEFGAMLRVNTRIRLDLPVLDAEVVDPRLVDSRNLMLIENRLNEIGRGNLLASSQTPKEEWVNALQKLTTLNGDDLFEVDLFEVGCLYSLLRLNPSVCLLEMNDTTNSVL